MYIDRKYLSDYVEQVQQVIIERHGVKINKGDLIKIMKPPFKNIVYALLKKHSVIVQGRLKFMVYQRYRLKKQAEGKTTREPLQPAN